MTLAPPPSHTPPPTAQGLLGDDLVDSRYDSVPDLPAAQAAAARRAKRRSYRRSLGAPPHGLATTGSHLSDAERLKEAYRADALGAGTGAGVIRATPQFAQSMSYLPDMHNRASMSSTRDSGSAGESSPTPSPFVEPAFSSGGALHHTTPLRASSAAHAVIQRKMAKQQQHQQHQHRHAAAAASTLSLSVVPLENEIFDAGGTGVPEPSKERSHRVFFSKPESTFGRWVNKLVRRGGVKV